jgi:hypothetical protein
LTPGHKKMPRGRKTATPGHEKGTPGGHKKVTPVAQKGAPGWQVLIPSAPFILVHFILFSSCHSKKHEKKLVLIRNVKPLEIVLDDDRAAREISNGRGFSRSIMLLLLVAAGGANKMNLISIEHLNCFIVIMRSMLLRYVCFYMYSTIIISVPKGRTK